MPRVGLRLGISMLVIPLAAGCASDRDAIDRRLEGLSEEEIGRDFSYSTTKGVPQRFILRDLLAHWFNHQTHHRGQAHCILTVLGVPEPKPLDLLAMYRKVPSGHQATSA